MTRLELCWEGKNDQPNVEPRLLVRDNDRSHGAPSENMLIHGDNLIALRSLMPRYAGKIKCVYIDPPYNTGSAFEHYDDNFEHTTWLNLMYPRLKLLRRLLSTDGSIWISIDDTEQEYLKVMLNEIFGRSNFVATVIWEKKYTLANDTRWISDNHDFIIVYAKDKNVWRPNLLPRTEAMDTRYTNPDNDPRGPWKSSPLQAKSGTKTDSFIFDNGVKWTPPPGRSWAYSEESMKKMFADNRIWFGKDGKAVPRVKKFLTEVKQGSVSKTIWLRAECGDNHEAKNESKYLFGADVFSTPKPERLIEKILRLATNEGDLVLDSFLGSGTTAAVAHKMHRRWIGIEIGDHAYTHCKVRLDRVVDGTDDGGITKSVGWKGGGGYDFYELAAPLMVVDKYGETIINPKYTYEMLSAAVALHENYRYEPDPKIFWKQSRGTEQSYLYVTDQYVSRLTLDLIAAQMTADEFLTIACFAHDEGLERSYDRIKLRRLPYCLLDGRR